MRYDKIAKDCEIGDGHKTENGMSQTQRIKK